MRKARGDLSQSLINYYEGKNITGEGLIYLHIYGANCHNEDNLSKKSNVEREKWVTLNLQKIINLDIDLILKADSIFLFTAFCLTMRNIYVYNINIVHLPVFLDATCSGIQHLAGILKDYETGSKVNLISQNKNDPVGDIYSDLINPSNDAINKYGNENLDNEDRIFKDIKLTRGDIKGPFMTKNYNVSIFGMSEQLKSKFKKVNKKKNTLYMVPTNYGYISLKRKQVFTLASLIDKQIFVSFPTLKVLYDYFKEVIKLTLVVNIPTVWFTPAGLKITQFYNVSVQNKVSIRFGNKAQKIVLKTATDKLDKKKQIQAIIPNIVHSLDSAHLINILNSSSDFDLNQILPIHDCFGVHPNDINKLTYLVKREFITLYTENNFLEKYHNRLIQALKDNNYNILTDKDNKEYILPKNKKYYIPIIPKFGKLDLTKIIESKYIIN
jgi:DNA-directed RNA polymerase, mitochondrial